MLESNAWWLIALACIWLAVCAVQYWRKREVSNGLTLPPLLAGLLLRLAGVKQAPVLSLLVVGLALFFAWREGWIGGADCKASLALALFDLRLLAWAWVGLGLWYALLGLIFRREDMQKLPGFVGFTTGAFLYLAYGVWNG